MAKHTIEVDITPTLGEVPALLMDIAALLESSGAGNADVDLQHANRELAAEVKQAWERARASEEEAKKLFQEAAELRAELQRREDGYAGNALNGDLARSPLFLLAKTLHKKRACGQLVKKDPLSVWVDPTTYRIMVEQKSEQLCSYCHGWSKNPALPKLVVGQGVSILPHDQYKSRTRGCVKAINGDTAMVRPKNHGHDMTIHIKYLRPLSVATQQREQEEAAS